MDEEGVFYTWDGVPINREFNDEERLRYAKKLIAEARTESQIKHAIDYFHGIERQDILQNYLTRNNLVIVSYDGEKMTVRHDE